MTRQPAVPPDRQEELWGAFLESYLASQTRPAVDMFLHALIGAPHE